MDIRKLQRAIVDALEDVKAKDIQVFDSEHLSPLFERVIIASASSNRQTKALASSVKEAVKKISPDMPRSEGEENGEWIIVDCGSVVVHIMQPVIRTYYQLEEIWGEKPVRIKLLEDKVKAKRVSEAKNGAEAKTAEKPAAEKVVTKKTPAKKAPVKKAPAQKVAAKKTPAKKVAAKKTVAKRNSAVKTPAKKVTKAPAKKVSAKTATK